MGKRRAVQIFEVNLLEQGPEPHEQNASGPPAGQASEAKARRLARSGRGGAGTDHRRRHGSPAGRTDAGPAQVPLRPRPSVAPPSTARCSKRRPKVSRELGIEEATTPLPSPTPTPITNTCTSSRACAPADRPREPPSEGPPSACSAGRRPGTRSTACSSRVPEDEAGTVLGVRCVQECS